MSFSRRLSISARWPSPPDSPPSPHSCLVSATRCARRASVRCPGSRQAARSGGQRALMARTLIGVQIAASLVLLVVAGLFVRTLYNYSQVDVGFDARNLLVFQIDPSSSVSEPSGVVRSVRTPGRCDRGGAWCAVGHAVGNARRRAQPVDRDGPGRTLGHSTRGPHAVGPLELLRDPRHAAHGRPEPPGRRHQRSSARGRGQRSHGAGRCSRTAPPSDDGFSSSTAANATSPFWLSASCAMPSTRRLSEPAPATFFMPYTQIPPRRMTVEVRTAGDALALTAGVRAAIHRIDPALPMIRVRTQEEQIAETIRDPRTVRRADRGVWSDRPSSGVYRALRRGVLRCEATHERNRRAHGTRCAAIGRSAARDGANVVDRNRSAPRWAWCSRPSGRDCSATSCSVFSPSTSQRWCRRPRSLVGVAGLAVFVPARRAARLDPTQALRHE